MKVTKNRITEIGGEAPTNGALDAISLTEPYVVEMTIEGTADMLFHRWNVEAVAEKAVAAKGSEAKKTDNVESYVWRTDTGDLGLPGEYLRQSIIHAAKYKQDPRSPRKSAMDLYKAGIVCLTLVAPLGVKKWDYMDMRRVVVQRNGITRSRPAMRKGWRAKFEMMVNLPEYISQADLRDTTGRAGRLIGVADFRPTYGRFDVVSWKVREP